MQSTQFNQLKLKNLLILAMSGCGLLFSVKLLFADPSISKQTSPQIQSMQGLSFLNQKRFEQEYGFSWEESYPEERKAFLAELEAEKEVSDEQPPAPINLPNVVKDPNRKLPQSRFQAPQIKLTSDLDEGMDISGKFQPPTNLEESLKKAPLNGGIQSPTSTNHQGFKASVDAPEVNINNDLQGRLQKQRRTKKFSFPKDHFSKD